MTDAILFGNAVNSSPLGNKHFFDHDTGKIRFIVSWFLPNKDELNELYNHRTNTNMGTGYYWSSSQYDNNSAWGRRISDYYHQATNYTKDFTCSVRAIRAF